MYEDDEDKPVLVDAGGFRVDRKRALSKLMQFQLPDPRMYILLLIRCAVATGATYLKIDSTSGGGIRVRFDGRPISGPELEFPYSSLFDQGGGEAVRNRELAIAILTMLRLGPKRVDVQSGKGEDRVLLRVYSLESEAVQPALSNNTETIVRAEPGKSGTPLWDERTTAMVYGLCRICPIPVEVLGGRLKRTLLNALGGERVAVHVGAIRGWVGRPPGLPRQSEVELCRFGVAVTDLSQTLPLVQVHGAVDSPDLRLNASQTGVIKDEARAAVLKALKEASEELVKGVVALQGERISRICTHLKDSELRKLWTHMLERAAARSAHGLPAWGSESLPLKLPPGMEDMGAELCGDAYRTLWLRTAAARARSADSKMSEELREQLRKAPLLVGTDMRPLTLAELEDQRGHMGCVPHAQHLFPTLESMRFRTAWAPCVEELDFLRACFPSGLSDMGPSLANERSRQLAKSPSTWEPGRELERSGFFDCLLRKRMGKGEIALPARRPEGGALVVLMRGGRTVQRLRMPGVLHFAAVVVDRTAEEAARDCMEAVPALYEEAAKGFQSDQRHRHDSGLREHLLDFLAWAHGGAEIPAEPYQWITGVELFRHGTTQRSLTNLRAAITEGETLYFVREHPQDFAPAFLLVDRRFESGFLKKILPGARLKPFPGDPSIWMAFRAPPRDCGLNPSKDCLVAWSVGGHPVHLAAGEGAGGMEVKAPWGMIRVYGAKAASAPPEEAVMALLAAAVREGGERRPWLLRAVNHYFGPWAEEAGSPGRRRLHNLLRFYPLFSKPGGGGLSIGAVDGRLRSGLRVTYAADDQAARGSQADVVLGPEELSLIRGLWPEAEGRFVPAWGARVLGAAAPKGYQAEEKSAVDAALEEGGAEPSAVTGPKLAFESSMLYQAELSEGGLRVLFGLPSEPLPGLAVTVREGESVHRFTARSPRVTLAGSALVDASSYKDPVDGPVGGMHPEVERLLFSMFRRFMHGLLDAWERRAPTGATHDALLAYLLLLVQVPSDGSDIPEPEWEELRGRIFAAPVFDTLDGGTSSLEDLRRASAEGDVVYASKRPDPVPEDAGRVPIVRYARWVSKILDGARLQLYTPPAPGVPEPPSPSRGPKPRSPRPVEGLSPLDRAVSRLADIFDGVRAERGVDPAACPPADALGFAEDGRGLIRGLREGDWHINVKHPMVRQVLESGLSPESQAEYLASMVYTEANRAMKNVTDEEDAAFQEALARRLVEER